MSVSTKNKIVKKLPKVRIVLGNGFDLHCHLKTKYADFFNSNLETYKKFVVWRSQMIGQGWQHSYLNFVLANRSVFWVEEPVIDSLTVWDLFFVIRTISIKGNDIFLTNPDIKWCEIEREMIRSFKESENQKYKAVNAINWHNIYDCFIGKFGSCKTDDVRIIQCFIVRKTNGEIPKDKESFFIFLQK